MRQIVETKTVFKFNELSEKAQEKAINSMYDTNVSHDWWEFAYEDFHNQLAELGLACKKFYFSLDRDSHIEANGLHFTDVTKFIEKGVQEGVKKSIIEIADLTINSTRYYHHEGYNIDTYHDIPDRCPRLKKVISSLVDRSNDKLQSLLGDFLSQLQKEYDYMTSREAILETIEANEYEFLEDGTFY